MLKPYSWELYDGLLEKPRCVARIKLRHVDIARDGLSTLATDSHGNIYIWRQEHFLRFWSSKYCATRAWFTWDSQHILYVDHYRWIMMRDVESGIIKAVFRGHALCTTNLAISRQGFASVCFCSLRLWRYDRFKSLSNVNRGGKRPRSNFDRENNAIAFNVRGDMLAHADYDYIYVRLVPKATILYQFATNDRSISIHRCIALSNDVWVFLDRYDLYFIDYMGIRIESTIPGFAEDMCLVGKDELLFARDPGGLMIRRLWHQRA